MVCVFFFFFNTFLAIGGISMYVVQANEFLGLNSFKFLLLILLLKSNLFSLKYKQNP